MDYFSIDPSLVNYGKILSGGGNSTTNPSMLSRIMSNIPGLNQANEYISKLGRAMTGNNQALIKALAKAGNIASIFGSPVDPNKGDTRLSQIANLVASGAAGSALAPPPAQPTQPTQQPTQPVQNTDVNQNGIPDKLETTTTTKTSVPASYLKSINMPFSSGAIGNALANPFQLSAGDNAGTPVANAPVPASVPVVNNIPPSVQNLNKAGITNEAQNMQDIGMLLGPGSQMEVYKQGPINKNAEAALVEARIKEARLPYDIRKLSIDAADTEAKLYGLFGYSPEAQGLVEEAKAIGKTRGEQFVVENFANSELGKLPIDKKMIPVVPAGIKTYGDLVRSAGSMDIMHNAMKLVNDRIVANIGASGRIGAADRAAVAQQLTALGQIETSLGQEQRALMSEIRQRENPTYVNMLGSPEEIATNLTTVMNLKRQLNDVNFLLSENRAASAKLRGVNVEISDSRRRPTSTTPSSKKLPVPFSATNKYKGQDVMVYNGAVYDKNGDFIDNIKK